MLDTTILLGGVISMCINLVLALLLSIPVWEATWDKGAKLAERFLEGSKNELEVLLEAKGLDAKERLDFLSRVRPRLRDELVITALGQLTQENKIASDRWVIEIFHHLGPRSKLRNEGPKALAQFLGSKTVDRLLKALTKKNDKDTRELLATLLVAIRHTDGSKKLHNRLWKLSSSKSLSAGLRVLATEALEAVSSKKLLMGVLDRYLREQDTYVRAALVRLAAIEVTPEIFKLISDHHRTLNNSSSREGEAVLSLAAKLGSDDAVRYLGEAAIYARTIAERTRAVELLTRFRDSPIFEEVSADIQRLGVENADFGPQLAVALLEGLVEAKAPQSFERLVEATEDSDVRMRLTATWLLKHYPHEKSIPVYERLLGDEASQVASAALWGLFRTRQGRAVDVILNQLKLLEKTAGLAYGDAIRVLEAVTGEKLGKDVAAWESWRKEHGPLPSPFFPKAHSGSRRTAVARFFRHRIMSYHVVFVLDISGSMQIKEGYYTRRQLLHRELSQALASLDERVDFSVLAFAGRCIPWIDGARPATPENVEAAEEFFRDLPQGGSTNFVEPLEKVFEIGRFDTVYFLSDGVPTQGRISKPEQLLKWLIEENTSRKISINTVGVGDSGDLLRSMALSNYGLYRPLQEHRDSETNQSR